MRFEEYLDSVGADTKEQISSLMKLVSEESPSHSKFCVNLWKECWLESNVWELIVSALRKIATTPNVDDVLQEIRTIFGARPCCGEPIKDHSPKFLGRLISKNRLAALLGRTEALETRLARSEIEAMLLPPEFADVPIDVDDNILERTPLGSHGKIWSTFDDSDDDAQPQLAHAEKPLRETQCCFGLPYCDELAIFLEYTPPPSPLRFPTIADAYAGPCLNDAFEPSVESDSCGRTRPNDDCPHNGDCGVPECVHEIVNGSALTKRPIGLKK